MSLLKSLAIDLFASKEKKVAIHIGELIQTTIVAINAVHEQFPDAAKSIAKSCRELVIAYPRGEEGYLKAYGLYRSLKDSGSPIHASAWIAAQLILADHAVARAGGAGVPSLMNVQYLQGLIEAFFKRHGVEAWNAPYIDHRFFEAHKAPAPALASEAISDLMSVTRATEASRKIMQFVLADVGTEMVFESDDTSMAAACFFAGIALHHATEHGVAEWSQSVVVETTLSELLDGERAKAVADNLHEYLGDAKVRLCVNGGRAAALLKPEDGAVPADLLRTLLKKAAIAG
jgi:hypothetical protein